MFNSQLLNYLMMLFIVEAYLMNSRSLAARAAKVPSCCIALLRAVAKVLASPVRAARTACK